MIKSTGNNKGHLKIKKISNEIPIKKNLAPKKPFFDPNMKKHSSEKLISKIIDHPDQFTFKNTVKKLSAKKKNVEKTNLKLDHEKNILLDEFPDFMHQNDVSFYDSFILVLSNSAEYKSAENHYVGLNYQTLYNASTKAFEEGYVFNIFTSIRY